MDKATMNVKNLDKVEMGSRIRARRNFLGWSREELADKLGVSTKYLADLECGARGITIQRFYVLTQVLDLSADYILTGYVVGEVDEIERARIIESIEEALRNCSIKQLRHTERMMRHYAEALKENE